VKPYRKIEDIFKITKTSRLCLPIAGRFLMREIGYRRSAESTFENKIFGWRFVTSTLGQTELWLHPQKGERPSPRDDPKMKPAP
jgi:hypothetical protein